MTHVETSNDDTSKKIFTKKIKRREEKKEFQSTVMENSFYYIYKNYYENQLQMAPEHVLGYQDWLNWFINKQTAIQNQISSTAEKNITENSQITGGNKKNDEKDQISSTAEKNITENSQITGGNKKNDEKENKKVSNKRTRESWNYAQTAVLVKLWKENIQLIESSRCNEAWHIIQIEVSKLGIEKSKRQCTDKLRNLKDQYKRAKENNRTSGAAPKTLPFFDDFDEILGNRDIVNIPEFKEVGVVEPFGNNSDEINSASVVSTNSKISSVAPSESTVEDDALDREGESLT